MRLNEDEARFLLLVLDRTYRDIKYQISDTDDSRFKAQLRREKELIEGMMERLTAAGIEPVSAAFPA